MSGGSYDYLEHKIVDNDHDWRIQAMVSDARAAGYPLFAHELEKLVIPKPSKALLNCIHAFEWWRSMDISQDTFEAMLTELEASIVGEL